MDVDNPKVYGDTSISDGVVYSILREKDFSNRSESRISHPRPSFYDKTEHINETCQGDAESLCLCQGFQMSSFFIIIQKFFSTSKEISKCFLWNSGVENKFRLGQK